MAKHLEAEMNKLRNNLLSLTAIVDDSVKKSVQALQTLSKPLAKEVLKLDDLIDQREVEIEEDCLKILALHQPVAIDLRYLIGVLKMNNDLERIGDLAVNISERTLYILKEPTIDAPFDISEMATKTFEMLKKSIDALITMDSELAKEVIFMDDQVDALNKAMYDLVYVAIKKHPENVASLLNYLSASRHLERMADYTTNIAEDVIYMTEGTIIRHNPEIFE